MIRCYTHFQVIEIMDAHCGCCKRNIRWLLRPSPAFMNSTKYFQKNFTVFLGVAVVKKLEVIAKILVIGKIISGWPMWTQFRQSAMQEFRKVAEELRLDLPCVQETYACSKNIKAMPILERKIIAMIIFNDNVGTTLIRYCADAHCDFLELSTSVGRFILINQYYQFCDLVEVQSN